MSTEIFAPHGANPLAQLRIQTARCVRIDFDRAVRSNVLLMDGDIMQSKIGMPKEDRPLNSLQFTFPIIAFQLMCPSSGQLAIDFTVSQSAMSRLRVTAATFISKADVSDAKGTPHVKLPFAVPRNVWTQAVIHIPGIVSHLFKLPAPKWIDSISVSGSVRIRRIFGAHDEGAALEKPSGMLLFTVPAYGPPVWRGVQRVGAESQQPAPPAVLQAQSLAAAASTPFAMRFIRDSNGEVRFVAAKDPAELMNHGTDSADIAAISANTPADEPDDDVDPPPPPHPSSNTVKGGMRSPRSEAIFQALQRGGRAVHLGDAAGAHMTRTGSAPPASHHSHELSDAATSYRRLVRATPQASTPQAAAAASGLPKASGSPAALTSTTPPPPPLAGEDGAVWGTVVVAGWDEAPSSVAGPAPTVAPQTTAARGRGAGAAASFRTVRGALPARGGAAASAVAPTKAAPPATSDELDVLVKIAERAPMAPQDYVFKPKVERYVGYGVGDLEVAHSSHSSDDDDDDDDADDDDDDDDDDV